MSKKVAVIDGNSLMHRAYHAVPPSMNAPDGTPTNAVFGFLSMLLKFIEIANPDAIICAFDEGKPAFRIEALERYKAQRPPMDDDLRVQFPLMEKLLQSMNVPVVRVKGWEGDDILGTVAARDEALGYETLLVTGDKDAYQLATDLTHIVTTKKGITDVAIYGPAEVEARYGVTPEQFPDFLGLKGDSSDNIPGVPGIGDKTAAKLLQQYGSLEGIYDNLDKLKGKQLENIRDNKDAAFISRQVATIVRDLDFELDVEQARFPAFGVEEVTEAFGEVRFTAHLGKVLALIGCEQKKEQADISWDTIFEGEEARRALEAALVHDESIAVALVEDEQASLFGSGLTGAFAIDTGVALLEGDEVLSAFADVVRKGSFVVLDAKQALQHIYPADTARKALITDADLMAIQAFDVGLAAYVINSSVGSYTMNSLIETYLSGSLPQLKDERETACAYAAATRALAEPIKRDLAQEGGLKAFDDIDMPLVPVLTLMERTGTAIDIEALSALGATTQTELDELSSRIIDLAGEKFNIDSPKQLSHILFDVIGLKPTKKTRTGYSTDASVLKELAKEHDLPKLILRYRELAKIKSTYIDALPRMRGVDGRVHTSFNETVTTTGRLSSSDPNLQNIPVRTDFGRQIRESFVPLEKGHKFLSADYSQIELRVLAHLSEDEGLIEAFKSGTDFHAQTASRVFGVPLDEVTPELRSHAKAVNFGIVYGQQAFGLAQSLDIPFNDAKAMIDRYFAAYPRVRAYLDETIKGAYDTGYASTLFGRRRHIPELKVKNSNQRGFGERTAMNHPMQGTAADIIKIAMARVQAGLIEGGYDAKLLLQVHDELDFSVPEREVAKLTTMVVDVMESVVELLVPLDVSVSWGDNWAQAH